MSLCAKNYQLTVTEGGDMPLDQAVYDPVRDVIFGVRGGYIQEYSNTGVPTTNKARFRPISFGESSIAYHAASDRLIVSAWNDPGWEYSQGNSPFRLLYKIHPATLAVEATFDVAAAFGVYSPIYGGPHNIVSVGANILGSYYLGNFVNAAPFYWNPITNASVDGGAGGIGGFQVLSVYSSWTEAILGSGGATVFATDPSGGRVWPVDSSNLQLNTNGGAGAYYVQWPTPNPTLKAPIGICQNPANGVLYVTSRSQELFKCSGSITSQAQAPMASLALSNAAANPWRARYNPNDGKIYVPGYASNSVFRIDLATDAITEEDALDGHLDSPFDMVFTPTKKFAVQHGSVGLKEIA